jgi:hypothetical protein
MPNPLLVPSVSAGSPNPPAPNKIDPGHTTGLTQVHPGAKGDMGYSDRLGP